MRPWLVISGAQTGADRGGLRAAVNLGIPRAGFVPAGWRAEDGVVPTDLRLGLVELTSRDYGVRTRYNVLASHVVLLVTGQAWGPGSKLTERLARESRRRLIHVNLDDPEGLAKAIVAWRDTPTYLQTVVDVAGSRESSRPGIEEATRLVCERIWLS